MKTAAILVAVLLAAPGCGDAPGEATDGTWVMAINQGCALAIKIDYGAKTWTTHEACRLSGGPEVVFGDQLEGGQIFFTKSQLEMIPKRTSCPEADHSAVTMTYNVSGMLLTLSGPSGALAFTRGPQNSDGVAATGAALRFGCWTMGTFSSHDVQDL